MPKAVPPAAPGTNHHASPLAPPLPTGRATALWHGLPGAAAALALAAAARAHAGLLLVVTADTHGALRLEDELRFFLRDAQARNAPDVLVFPDWETLPYDVFSPHQDIVAQRLSTLYRLPETRRGVLIVPVATLLARLCPRGYLDSRTLLLAAGDTLDVDAFRRRLEQAGYRHVAQVMEHGEFAVRGAIVDLFPSSSERPFRIDLFDDEIDTIRTFDPESQRSIDRVDRVELLPAREFPLDKEAITRFRHGFRSAFGGDPSRSPLYRDVSNGNAPGGVEYYLPLFFDGLATLFDYLPERTLAVRLGDVAAAAAAFGAQLAERYEQRRHDLERPLLPPHALYLPAEDALAALAAYPQIAVEPDADGSAGAADDVYFSGQIPPPLPLNPRADDPAAALRPLLAGERRILFAVESAGRREALLETLAGYDVHPRPVDGWADFLAADAPSPCPYISVAPLEHGLLLDDPPLVVVSEDQLYGERVRQTRRRRATRDAESVVRNLADLAEGDPVVHEDHGVGRYRGLQRLALPGQPETEFVVLEYAAEHKLYVPVASLHLLSRYSGAAVELAPLHRIGSDQWGRAKRKAAEKVYDVAAELLDVYARREARSGHAYALSDADYAAFAAGFPFEETPDQEATIAAVIADMRAPKPMDRVVCGDVGFGKTEVAMRAAFVAVQDGRQAAVLVPTTLLAQQHYQNFRDRFADWPVRIELLSRFRTKKQQDRTLADLADGRVDILIGTHKVLQPAVKFSRLGLVMIDEEQRFGVRQKERLKALRSEVDVLTLTATPIPRTLNLALSGLRDLSLIVTPPAGRLAVKTFVGEWNKATIQEACQRELKRGGQVYFLHNEVGTIERVARELGEIVPEATIRIGHGQMRERELEQVMLDFYHQRCQILVCTTIVESGIDVPNANTILINRADRLGLAQLHQLRGRVGRSHHRAYAYLIVPPKRSMTADAVKRIEAIETLEDLGAGFLLANHDLEIRGAGELLGDEQSGQIHEVGFALYMDMLERAVKALKDGRRPELTRPLDHGPEIDLQVPALIPEDYLPDVHARLVLYKRIASAADDGELKELQVEMIDRFGTLPAAIKNLFAVTALKLRAVPLGVRKIEAGPRGGRIIFTSEPRIDVGKLLLLIQTQPSRYRLDGQDKLRFKQSLGNADARVAAVDGLLTMLADDGDDGKSARRATKPALAS